MSTLSIVLWMFALALAVFGVLFILVGLNSERGYWSQRDPSGNARTEATPLAQVFRHEWHFATGEYRAPLRITAIGLLIVEIGVVFAIAALISTWAL